MAEIVQIGVVPLKKQISNSALELAEWLIDRVKSGEVQELVFVTFDAADYVWVRHSGTMSITKTVGALERAKFDILLKGEKD